MTQLALQHLAKSFGDTQVLKPLDLTIPSGAFVVLVGPSGCGKSTLLRLISGLETPTQGAILMDEVDVAAVPPKDRNIAMVFQNYALYPHMSVADNLAFGLKMRNVPIAERQAAVQQVAETLKLTPLLHRKPKELSGGQRQRVALGRAMVRKPKLFLMDEPLSNLDAQLRQHMRFELAQLHQTLKTTTLYVTHDQVEAMTLADLMVILHQGEIQQAAPPNVVYATPANTFVANFIGKMNLLPATPLLPDSPEGLLLGFRPEAVSWEPPAEAVDCLSLSLLLERKELHGGTQLFFARLGDALLQLEAPASLACALGEPLTTYLPKAKLHFFDAETGRRHDAG